MLHASFEIHGLRACSLQHNYCVGFWTNCEVPDTSSFLLAKGGYHSSFALLHLLGYQTWEADAKLHATIFQQQPLVS